MFSNLTLSSVYFYIFSFDCGSFSWQDEFWEEGPGLLMSLWGMKQKGSRDLRPRALKSLLHKIFVLIGNVRFEET